MRHMVLTVALLNAAAGFAVAAPLAANAEETCLDTMAVIERVQNPDITAGKLTEPQIKKLAAAFSEAYPGQTMATGNHALVFHRRDAPVVDWMVLFQDGCAKYELPIDSNLVEGVMEGTYVDPMSNFDSLAPDKAP